MARVNPRSTGRHAAWLFGLAAALALTALETPAAQEASRSLLLPSSLVAPPAHLAADPWRPVRLDEKALNAAILTAAPVEIELFDGSTLPLKTRKTIHNRSGSISWIGDSRSAGDALVVIVVRDGVAIGSIRSGAELYMLSYAGEPVPGEHVHVLHQVDERAAQYRELAPTPVHLDPARLAAAERTARRQVAGLAPQDDGSIQDLLVVYTQRAVNEVGGVVAMENLIDLGVTETNLSYETSGVIPRLRLAKSILTDFDEMTATTDARDHLQDPNDGVMDEIHAVRDEVAADLVMLINASQFGCGRAFIMNEISLAHADFAFCRSSVVCVSPGYTFQHELGHIQSGRHQRTIPDPTSPFPNNFGFTDPTNQFRTIMAAGSSECPDGCPRRLAWSNPDVIDPESGAPMGNSAADPLPTDMRQTLNEVRWTVANFRVSNREIFADGFEAGNTNAWQSVP